MDAFLIRNPSTAATVVSPPSLLVDDPEVTIIEPPPLGQVFDDDFVVQLASGWQCLYCNETRKVAHSSRALGHFVPGFFQGVSTCKNTTGFLTKTRRDRFKALAELLTAKKANHQKRNQQATDSSATTSKAISDAIVPKHTKLSVYDDPPIDSNGQMTINFSMQRDSSSELTGAIANFIHGNGLPFSLVDKPAFKNILTLARKSSPRYEPPTSKRMGNELLDLTYNSYVTINNNLLDKQKSLFGLSLFGDGATIHKKPLLNVLASGVHNTAAILEIVDATVHLAAGGKKDARYIAKCFLPHLLKLDPDNTIIDCVLFDGAANVQKGGQVLAGHNPRISVLKGVEHVLALFCKDVSKVWPINILIRKYRILYHIFGSGSHHGPYAYFQETAKDYNNGRAIGLIKPADTQMAGYYIAFHRLCRLKEPMISCVHSVKWRDYKFGAGSSLKKSSVESIVEDPLFWKELHTITQAMFPVLKSLCLADSNLPGMDKILYYARCSETAITNSVMHLDGDPETGMFLMRPETLAALNWKSDPKSTANAPVNDDDLDPEEEDDNLFLNQDKSLQCDLDIDDSEDDTDSNVTDEDDGETNLQYGLQIQALWNKRKVDIMSDFAVLGWLLSVVPEIQADAKTYTLQHRNQAENVLRKLLYNAFHSSDVVDDMLNHFWSSLHQFHNHTGCFAEPRIWNHQYVHNGLSYKWHEEITMKSDHYVLGFVGCRVTSKILGIGAAERSWGDVKKLGGHSRINLSSDKLAKQSMVYSTQCIEAKCIYNQNNIHEWQAFDLAVDDFNADLESFYLTNKSTGNTNNVRQSTD